MPLMLPAIAWADQHRPVAFAGSTTCVGLGMAPGCWPLWCWSDTLGLIRMCPTDSSQIKCGPGPFTSPIAKRQHTGTRSRGSDFLRAALVVLV